MPDAVWPALSLALCGGNLSDTALTRVGAWGCVRVVAVAFRSFSNCGAAAGSAVLRFPVPLSRHILWAPLASRLVRRVGGLVLPRLCEQHFECFVLCFTHAGTLCSVVCALLLIILVQRDDQGVCSAWVWPVHSCSWRWVCRPPCICTCESCCICVTRLSFCAAVRGCGLHVARDRCFSVCRYRLLVGFVASLLASNSQPECIDCCMVCKQELQAAPSWRHMPQLLLHLFI